MKTIRPRHAVINPDGSAVEDTVRFPRLHAVGELLVHRHAEDETQPVPVVRDVRSAATTVLPVHGARTIVMRRPVAPSEPPLSVQFPRSFFEIPEFVQQLDEMSGRVHAETARMFREFGVKMNALLRRARTASAQWRYAGTGGAGYDMAAAYAQGGTEQVLKMTPEVLAEMDRRAKAGASL